MLTVSTLPEEMLTVYIVPEEMLTVYTGPKDFNQKASAHEQWILVKVFVVLILF